MKKLITHISGVKKLTQSAYDTLFKVSKINYVSILNQNQLNETLKQCDVFWFRLNHKITSETLKGTRCKYILCAVTGLDHIDLDACKKNNIVVISLKNEKEFLKEVRATAEHSFGLLLALIRKSKSAFIHTESFEWNRNLFKGEELYKKKIGILGLGRLGTIVANYAEAFGMQVFYYDQSNDIKTNYIKCKSIEELVKKVDVLSIHITYDTSTKFILNKSIFNKIIKGLYIINTSRGGVVNEDDLLTYIKNGKVKGYAADVLYEEPDIKSNQLINYAKEHENVIITPHIAGYTRESIEKTEAFIAKKFVKQLKQLKIENTIFGS